MRNDLLEQANLAALLDHLPKASILPRYANARGDELRDKFLSPESSSALVANAFGFFLERPGALTLPCPPLACGEAVSVLLEEEMRFPWSGGTHPWLDVVIETKSAVIGIESKRYEPYRDKKQIKFSDAYSRAIWGDQMFPFETMRDELRSQRHSFQFARAAQLVKHAFGLRTQAHAFRAACTPGYYNGEGRSGAGFLDGLYGPGSVAFFELAREWREDMPGLSVG